MTGPPSLGDRRAGPPRTANIKRPVLVAVSAPWLRQRAELPPASTICLTMANRSSGQAGRSASPSPRRRGSGLSAASTVRAGRVARAAHLFTANLGPPFGAAACRCTGYTGPARRPPRLLKQFLQAASLECPRMPWDFGNSGQNQSGSRTSLRRNYLAPLRWFPLYLDWWVTRPRTPRFATDRQSDQPGQPIGRVAGRAQRPPRSATTAPTEGCPPPSPLSRDWG
jgi:hypothetical protein